MRRVTVSTAALSAVIVLGAGPAPAAEAFIPPTVQATITGVSNQPLADGTTEVTLQAELVNNGALPLDAVSLQLSPGGVPPMVRLPDAIEVGTIEVATPVSVTLSYQVAGDLDPAAAFDPATGIAPVITASAVDAFGDPIAVWIDLDGGGSQ